MSKVVRTVKNVTKGYSSVQVKVRNATSNDPWGPTGTDMAEIAAMTFNNPSDFYEIMDMLDKRLNDKGKNWRHVLKSLKVLDYCLHEGSELVVTWARKNVYIIKTLREFQYVDEESRDVGQNVRVSAKELTSLIMDEERLRSERSDRKLWKSRVQGIDDYQAPPQAAGPSERPRRRPQRSDEDDTEFRLAIEASKHEAEEEERRRRGKHTEPEDDDDLAKAIKLSKEEEELRRRELENKNAASLFDDTPVASQPQPTGWNQGYQQQPAVDWFGNPIQQPQQTGFLNNQYAQPQQTGFGNGYTNGFGAQPTGFDQFGQQQQQQQFQQQPTGYNNLYGQQQNTGMFGQQPQQPEPMPTAGSHNPWATNNQQQADALKPMPTGSNNPFAQRPQPQAQRSSPSALQSLSETSATNNFMSSPNPIQTFQSSTPQPQPQMQRAQSQPQKPLDPHHERLNNLLASGEGQDTFGNVGDLRIPAQHTAPGTFVNSAGQGLDKMRANQTGNNPFFSQQFTGAPGPSQGGFNTQIPAQTGPVGGGFGGFGGHQQQQQQQQQQSNPFGSRPQAQSGGGSLIDL